MCVWEFEGGVERERYVCGLTHRERIISYECMYTHVQVVEGRLFSFPKSEAEILGFWEEHDCFHTQLELSRAAQRPQFNFYDGPPFATGLPHYGHILAGTIKDVVTRYACSRGFHVERRFGWDCHGVPVEHEIDKALGVTCREDVTEKITIAKV